MPYFINTWRTPKHGHFKEVEKAARESLEGSGKPGNISVTFSSPRPTDSNLKVIGTVAGFQSPTDVENFFNSIWEDDTRFSNLERINSLCDQSSVSVSRILNPGIGRFENFEPKFVARLFVTPAKGAFPELSKLVVDWSQDTNLKVNTVVSHNMSGPATQIRISQFGESLEILEELQAEAWANERMQRFTDLVAGPPTIGLSRITLAKPFQ